MKNERLALFVSGTGTTAKSVIETVQNNQIPNLEIACMIACRENTPAIQVGKNLGMTLGDNIIIVDPQEFQNEHGILDMKKFGEVLVNELVQRRASVITQNGWLHITPDSVIDAFPHVIFNQHPGRLEFGGKGMFGLRVHAATLEFERLVKRQIGTQATVHRVTHDVDEGAVVGRVGVETRSDDTPESLGQRVLPQEHMLMVDVLKKFMTGNLKELHREIFLLPQEEGILETAKDFAKKSYPQGHRHTRAAA